jgi:hypothetical protein
MAREIRKIGRIFLGRIVRGDGRWLMRGWQKGRFDYAPKQDKGRDRTLQKPPSSDRDLGVIKKEWHSIYKICKRSLQRGEALQAIVKQT